jgi:hypothetical protein
MELAWPRHANEAIAIVVAKGALKKGTITEEIARERLFRYMARPPENQ